MKNSVSAGGHGARNYKLVSLLVLLIVP
jgi:hypothetical protein